MLKIRKYTLKKKHKNRLTGGSNIDSNLNRKQRRQLNRALPKLQTAIRSRISHNLPTSNENSSVLSQQPIITPQTSPITIPRSYPITRSRRYRGNRGRGRRNQTISPITSPLILHPISPSNYLQPITNSSQSSFDNWATSVFPQNVNSPQQSNTINPTFMPNSQTQHYIPVLQPIPIPNTETATLDSEGNEIINVNDESNNEYILSIDRKGNVTVLKDGSSPIEGGGKSRSRHSPNSTSQPKWSIDGLINIFLHFCNKYEYHSVELWRNRNVIAREDGNDIRKDVFRLSNALNDYNESVDDSNQYSINSYMDESLELIPISFKTLFVDNHDDVGSYYSTIALLDFDLNTVGVDRNGNIVNLLEYAENYLKREIEIRDELVEVIRNNNEENINPNVRHWIETANDEIIDYEWKIDVLRAFYAIKDAKFKESKRQRESSNYKLANIPDDISNELAKFQFGGAWTENAIWSALLYGHSPNLEKFKLAIESGADVNEQNHRGDTPLICLSSGYRMNIEMVDLLLTNNADPNLQDKDGETALHWAAFKGYLIVVERLLESKNIDINITNKYGGNALHSIFKDEESGTGNYGSYSERCFDNVEPIVKLLIEKGININETDEDGKTPLHLAAEQNHGGAVGILLRAGADENIKTDEVYWRNGQTAYELAENIRNMIELHRDASVRAMFDDDAAASDDDDSTSIDADRKHYIYVKRNCPWYGVIDVLQKTSLSSDNEYSLWAYEPLALNAFHQFHREKAQAYLAEEAKNEDSYLNSLPDELEEGIRNMFGGTMQSNEVWRALENNDLEQMRVAIESGANVNVQSRRGNSPLISLAKGYYYPNAEIVDLLLTNNADPNLQDRGGETALHWAAAKGYLEIVKKLLESENIGINITDREGRNALHSIFDDEEAHDLFDLEHVETIMKLLIEKGININETDNSGKTALHLAAEQNHGNAVGILLRAGADENIKTYDYHPAGQTAYELAENKKNTVELQRDASVRALFEGDEADENVYDFFFDDDNSLWAYEPLALNAFHQFHRAQQEQAYLAEEAKNEHSHLNSLPDELEAGIRKMLGGHRSNRKKDGGGQIFSSNKKNYELEFLNNELSKTRKRYNTYGKLLAVNQLIPKNVDNDIWDFAMKCYNIYKKNYVPHEHAPTSAAPPLHSDRHATMIQTMVRGTLVRGKLETERLFFDKMLSENANQPDILIDWMQTWIDEDTLELIENTMRFIWKRRAHAWPEPAIIGNSNTTDILRSFKKAFSINSTPEIVLIVYLKVLAFIIEYNYLGLTLDDVDVEGKEVAIKRLDAIFKSIYNKENYELSVHKVNFENPFISHIDTREMTEIIDYITFYKEIAIESLTTIYELFEKHDNVFEYLLEQVKKNDKIDKEQDQKKMHKLRKRRVNMWGKHYRHPINRLPEAIETKIDENLL